jgi:hypothetical protein
MIELINRHTEAERHFIDKSFERVLKITNVPIEESSVDDLLAVIKLVNKFLDKDNGKFRKVVNMEYQRYHDNENLFEQELDFIFVELQ